MIGSLKGLLTSIFFWIISLLQYCSDMGNMEDLTVIAPKFLSMLQEHQTDIAGVPVYTALLAAIIASVVFIVFTVVPKRKVALR